MNGEQIKIMAHKSGLTDWFNSENDEYIDFANCLDKFAALVAEAEREECAKLVERYTGASNALAQAIRARGEK